VPYEPVQEKFVAVVPMQIDACGDGSCRQPLGHAVTSGAPPRQSPTELPSSEQVGVVSPVNSPQPPASPSEPLELPELLPLEPPLLLPLELELPLLLPLEVLLPELLPLPPELPLLPLEPPLPELPPSAPCPVPPSPPGPEPPALEEEHPAARRTARRAAQGRVIAERVQHESRPGMAKRIPRSFARAWSRLASRARSLSRVSRATAGRSDRSRREPRLASGPRNLDAAYEAASCETTGILPGSSPEVGAASSALSLVISVEPAAWGLLRWIHSS